MTDVLETAEIPIVDYVDPDIDDVMKVLSALPKQTESFVPLSEARSALMRDFEMSRYTAWRNLLIADGLGRVEVDSARRVVRLT